MHFHTAVPQQPPTVCAPRAPRSKQLKSAGWAVAWAMSNPSLISPKGIGAPVWMLLLLCALVQEP